MKWKRNQLIVNRQVDPTELVTFTLEVGKFRFVIDQFFGDVSSRWYWKGNQIFFTSVYIHHIINKYFERKYKDLDKKEEDFNELEPDFCWHCGSIQLRSGFIGEGVISCEEGHILSER